MLAAKSSRASGNTPTGAERARAARSTSTPCFYRENFGRMSSEGGGEGEQTTKAAVVQASLLARE